MPLTWPSRGEHRNNPWDIFVRKFLAVSHEGDGTIKTSVTDAIRSGLALDPHDHAELQPKILYPVGFQAANTATETATVSTITFVQYLGKAPKPITTITIRTRVTTAAATITWAEVAILTGPLGAPGVGPTLNLSGFTDVAATFNSTGLKNTTIALTGVDAGEEIWVAWGSAATTPFQLRAGLGDDLTSGTVAIINVRPSLVSNTGFGASSNAPAWLVAYI